MMLVKLVLLEEENDSESAAICNATAVRIHVGSTV